MNPIFKKRLARRTFLKGGSYVVALPLLEAMIPALTKGAYAQASTQKNFMYIYFPFGHKPLGDQSRGEVDTPWLSYTFEQNLSILKDYLNQKRLIMMQGMHHSGDEHSAASTLTANRATNETNGIVRNESFDHYLSRTLAGASNQRYPLLTLGVRGRASRDSLRRHHICWRAPGQFINKEMNPVSLYNKIFANMNSNNLNAQARHDLTSKLAAVDSVLEDLRSFKKQLGQEDNARLEAYFDNLRSLEKRLEQNLNNTPASRSIAYTQPSSNGDDTFVRFEERAQAMLELSMIAFATSQSQVSSLMLDDSGQGFGYFSDYNRSYHSDDDNGGMHGWPSTMNRTHLYNVHKMLARLYKKGVDRMLEYNIFSDTALLMSSECGFHHVPTDTHFLCSGGIFEGAQSPIKFYDAHVGRLYTAIAQKFGINLGGFGASQGSMSW